MENQLPKPAPPAPPKQPVWLLAAQLMIPLVYGLVQLGLSWIDGNFSWEPAILLAIGALLGVGVLVADRWYLYTLYEDQNVAVPGLVTRSMVFMLALIPLGVFIMSSSGSRLGVGVLMGVMAGLVLELWWYHRIPELFHRTFLFQVKREYNQDEIKTMVYVATLALGIATMLLF